MFFSLKLYSLLLTSAVCLIHCVVCTAYATSWCRNWVRQHWCRRRWRHKSGGTTQNLPVRDAPIRQWPIIGRPINGV